MDSYLRNRFRYALGYVPLCQLGSPYVSGVNPATGHSAEAHDQQPRDKSAWRKSNLNVPNSAEGTGGRAQEGPAQVPNPLPCPAALRRTLVAGVEAQMQITTFYTFGSDLTGKF